MKTTILSALFFLCVIFSAGQVSAGSWGININTTPSVVEYQDVFVQHYDYLGNPILDRWGNPVGHYVSVPVYGRVVHHESIHIFLKSRDRGDYHDYDRDDYRDGHERYRRSK